MPNPLNGFASSPEDDAFFLGVGERYDSLLRQDQQIIENLPLNFAVKNSIYATMLQMRTIQRYSDLVGRQAPDFGLGDALLVTIGNAGTMQLLGTFGYSGSDDFRMMLGFLARIEQEQRARLLQPPTVQHPEED